MLLKLRVKNFCSFKNEFIFSMKPGKVIDRFRDNVVCITPRFKVLKSAVVAGENAGGKTCFMKSLHYLQYLFESDDFVRMIKRLSFNNDPNSNQFFEISIVANNLVYTYSLELDIHGITSEILNIRNLNEKESSDKEIYRVLRTKCENCNDEANNKTTIQATYQIRINGKYFSPEVNNIIKTYSAQKGLFINYLNTIGVDIVAPFVEWIKDRLVLELPADHSLNLYRRILKDEEDLSIIKTDSFMDIFSLVDSSICAIEIDDENPFEKTVIVRKIEDNNYFKIELRNESSGVKEFFAWAIQLWKVINKNAVLFADEIDRVLNAILAEKIITFVQGTEHSGQFIFSTHNVLHLNTNNFMKEQIYFVTKQKSTISSEMYSLSDFKDYRYEKSDVYDLYLKGILGGVPND